MTPDIVATTASRPRIADLVRAAGRKLSDRMHAAADDRAQALGWTVTETPVGSACTAAATTTRGSPRGGKAARTRSPRRSGRHE